MPDRIGLSKRVRFEVLKRDKFTCQYCGRRPPIVTLHVDHVLAVARGGDDSTENLLTSCADCNLGKGPRELVGTDLDPDGIRKTTPRKLHHVRSRSGLDADVEQLCEFISDTIGERGGVQYPVAESLLRSALDSGAESDKLALLILDCENFTDWRGRMETLFSTNAVELKVAREA